MENEAVASDPLIGKIISERYRVLERIGRGGFGAVYKVQHIRLDKTLALKVLFEHTHQNPRMIKRFEREARATCRIGHDNIVEITDFARDRRVGYYFVMEYLVGETLADRLRKLGPMPAARIIHIGCQIADALAATHAKGIVHRDLKPDNIFLVRKRNEDAFVKILDFGIAAMGDLEEQSPRLTRHGTMLGTPAYMSPEQAEGKPPDHRSDIYSLGIILYEMSTGQVPYRNAASMAVLEMHRSTEPVPPREARPDLHIAPSLERVVLRALRKTVAQRYQSMREVYNDMVNVSQQIDMSEVVGIGRRPEVRVDGPPAPPPDDIEPEEPEWLDEDLVLLDDDDPSTTRLLAAADDGTEESLPAITLEEDAAPRPVEGGAPAALEIGDDDIVESTASADGGAPQAPVREVPIAPSPRITTPLAEPRWSRSPEPSSTTTPTPAADASTTVRRAPAKTPTRDLKRRKASAPLWQRPPVLVAAGFALTLLLYGAFLAATNDWTAGPAVADAELPGAPATAKTRVRRDEIPQTRPVEAPASEAPAEDESRQASAKPFPDDESGEEESMRAVLDRAEADLDPDPDEPVEESAIEEVPEEVLVEPPPIENERQVAALEVARRPAGPASAPPTAIVAREAEGLLARLARAPLELDFSTVELTLESDPPGAAVYRGKSKLGKTPFSVVLDRGAGKAKLLFKRKGYSPKTKKVTLNGDKTVVVKLKKPSSGSGSYRPYKPSGGYRSGPGNSYEEF